MNRLTEKRDNFYVDTEECVVSDCSTKLGQLEDIEEELGIDLITFFKALKYGVYYFPIGIQELERDCVYLMDNDMSVGPREKLSYSFITVFERQTLFFDDYGKTWALTKEELDNENYSNL